MQADEIIEASTYALAAQFVATLPRLVMALLGLALTYALVRAANGAMRSVLPRTRMRRDIFENFLAGILILYREPFRLGDCASAPGSRASSRT